MPAPPTLLCTLLSQKKRGGIGGSIELFWKKSNSVHAMCYVIRIRHVPSRALCAIWNNPTIETAKQHEMTGHHAMKRIIINNKKIKH